MRRDAETLFLGSFVNKIDAKGRLATPARFRRVLELEKATTVYVIPSPDEPCLEVGGPAYIESLTQSIMTLPRFSDERMLLQKRLTGKTLSLSMDSEGRFILPKELRDHARLNGEAAFSGQMDFFQIWSPEGLDEAIGDDAKTAAARKDLPNPSGMET